MPERRDDLFEHVRSWGVDVRALLTEAQVVAVRNCGSRFIPAALTMAALQSGFVRQYLDRFGSTVAPTIAERVLHDAMPNATPRGGEVPLTPETEGILRAIPSDPGGRDTGFVYLFALKFAAQRDDLSRRIIEASITESDRLLRELEMLE